VQHDLRPAVVAGVEVLVGLRGVVEGQVVADDEGRLRLARGDEVAQLAVVLLDGARPVPTWMPLNPGTPQSSANCPFWASSSVEFGSSGT
jgi:hypothetical protein